MKLVTGISATASDANDHSESARTAGSDAIFATTTGCSRQTK